MADPSFNIESLTPSQQMLYQKQQEHSGLQALLEASSQLVQRIEKLAEMSNVMADGGEGMSFTFIVLILMSGLVIRRDWVKS